MCRVKDGKWNSPEMTHVIMFLWYVFASGTKWAESAGRAKLICWNKWNWKSMIPQCLLKAKMHFLKIKMPQQHWNKKYYNCIKFKSRVVKIQESILYLKIPIHFLESDRHFDQPFTVAAIRSPILRKKVAKKRTEKTLTQRYRFPLSDYTPTKRIKTKNCI